MPVPRTKTAVQALLAAHGLQPVRRRGQHFLVDGNLIEAIVRSAGVEKRDCVLEVGTGTGILTDALAERAGRVISCDLDARLQEVTRGLRDWPSHVRFVAVDVLAGKHRLNPELRAAWEADAAPGMRLRLIANLPYNVATPLLANLLWEGVEMHDAVVLVQKEAADRFLAAPGTAEYGPVSVAVRLLAEAEVLRQVGAQVFWPRPKVRSALLRIAPRDPLRARRLAEAGLPALLHRAFLHRRKMLRRALPPPLLAAAGVPGDARPQEVEPESWVRLLTVPPA